ncbi:MAG: SIR2 family protein [Polyangiales bacterium]
MKYVSLETAATRIRETHRQNQRTTSPYFFVCGAGISVPSVPLAHVIEAECRTRALRLGTPKGSAPDDAGGAYSYWLEEAWPDPDQRRAYFRAKIEGKPLTDANLRLAHLLGSGSLTNLVVTSNFDDFLRRGLELFGYPHVVCDHPATSARIDLSSDDKQVVHVHGTYWFYDLVNTGQEIAERARGMRGGTGMSDLLDDALRSRAPLVVGYSGWEQDVIMQSLRQRLKSGLRHQLYWFLYNEHSGHDLPSWLRDHPNVRFVVDERTLPAERVFEALLRAFRVAAPALTRDPLRFFAGRLRATAPQRNENAGPDLYYFDEVIRRVSSAAEGASKSPLGELERIRNAIRRGRFDEAASYARQASRSYLGKSEQVRLADALWPAVIRGGRDPRRDLRIIAVFLALARGAGMGPKAVPPGRVAAALITRVSAYQRLSEFERAADSADEALAQIQAYRMPRAVERLRRLKERALRQGCASAG